MLMRSTELPWLHLGEHLRINLPTRASVLDLISERLPANQGFSIATLNLDHAVLLEEPGDFRTAYARHSHITADGHPIAWMARRLNPDVERVTGSDLIIPCVEIAAKQGTPIGFIGATMEVLDAADAELHAKFPELKTAIKIAPSYPFDPKGQEADEVIQKVIESGAGLCLLALGAPRQEILASRLSAAAPHMGVISVGAGIDFIAGTAKRAPGIFQRTGMEWFWRFCQEPRRLGPRYWRCGKLLPHLIVRARNHTRQECPDP